MGVLVPLKGLSTMHINAFLVFINTLAVVLLVIVIKFLYQVCAQCCTSWGFEVVGMFRVVQGISNWGKNILYNHPMG